MISKKVKIRGLPKLGKILDFRPPLSVPEVGEFKDRFETQLLRLFEQDDLAVNQTTLSPRKFSPRDQFRQLGTYDSDCLEVDDLVRSLLPIWGFLKLEEYVSYDPDDLIAKILELVVLIRRKGKAKAFGSGSKNDPDKIYKNTLSGLGSRLQGIKKNKVDELVDQLIDAGAISDDGRSIASAENDALLAYPALKELLRRFKNRDPQLNAITVDSLD